jgi:hypothetical protein
VANPRVCPLVCAKDQKADGNRCVAITCNAGSALGSDGVCHKHPDQAAQPKPVAGSEPVPRDAAARENCSVSNWAAYQTSCRVQKCYTFNGKRICEYMAP